MSGKIHSHHRLHSSVLVDGRQHACSIQVWTHQWFVMYRNDPLQIRSKHAGIRHPQVLEYYCIWFCTIPSPIRNIILVTWLCTGYHLHPLIEALMLDILELDLQVCRWPRGPTFDPRNSVEKKPCLPLNYLQVVYKMGWLRRRLTVIYGFWRI